MPELGTHRLHLRAQFGLEVRIRVLVLGIGLGVGVECKPEP